MTQLCVLVLTLVPYVDIAVGTYKQCMNDAICDKSETRSRAPSVKRSNVYRTLVAHNLLGKGVDILHV